MMAMTDIWGYVNVIIRSKMKIFQKDCSMWSVGATQKLKSIRNDAFRDPKSKPITGPQLSLGVVLTPPTLTVL